MEYILIIVASIITIILLKIGLNVKIKDIKRIKEIGYDKNLNNIANKFPENKEICIEILEKLNNKDVKIEENKESKTSLYIAITNKIIIADIKDTFTRIQTIAHECLHSVQNRKILLFNFIYSNFYLLYFIVSLVLILFNIGESLIFVQGFIFLSIVYLIIRCYLENEAMSKAIFVAKEYMDEQERINENVTKEDVNLLVEKLDVLNKIGIPLTNFSLLVGCILKIIILCIGMII